MSIRSDLDGANSSIRMSTFTGEESLHSRASPSPTSSEVSISSPILATKTTTMSAVAAPTTTTTTTTSRVVVPPPAAHSPMPKIVPVPAPAPVIVAPPPPAPPPVPKNFDDPRQVRRFRIWYLLAGLAMLAQTGVLAAVAGALDQPKYQLFTFFSGYVPNQMIYRVLNVHPRGFMTIAPYTAIFTGILAVGYLSGVIFARRMQRNLGRRGVNYLHWITITLSVTWLVFLVAFAIGVSSIFLLLCLAGLATCCMGFWLVMHALNRPGTRRFNLWSHLLGWIPFLYIGTVFMAYTWARINRDMSAVVFVAAHLTLLLLLIMGFLQLAHFLHVKPLASVYTLDRAYLVVNVLLQSAIAWLLFAAFTGKFNDWDTDDIGDGTNPT